MPDKEASKQGFFENAAANFVGNIVAIVVFTVGSALLSYAATHLTPSLFATWYIVLILLVGAYVTGLGLFLTYRAWRGYGKQKGRSSLAFRIMLEEAKLLQQMYRRLNFDDPEHTKLPLHRASWPNFQPPTTWTYTSVMLYSLHKRVEWLALIASKAFDEFGWNESVDLFTLPESTIIIDLLPAVESFIALLQAKIKLLES